MATLTGFQQASSLSSHHPLLKPQGLAYLCFCLYNTPKLAFTFSPNRTQKLCLRAKTPFLSNEEPEQALMLQDQTPTAQPRAAPCCSIPRMQGLARCRSGSSFSQNTSRSPKLPRLNLSMHINCCNYVRRPGMHHGNPAPVTVAGCNVCKC